MGGRKITNRHNVPLALAVWAVHDEYQYINKPNYISVTTLMRPLRMLVLGPRVPVSLQPPEDVIDFVARSMGHSVHASVEHAWRSGYKRSLGLLGYPPSVIDRIVIDPEGEVTEDQIPIYMEQRSFRDIAGYTVGGQYDMVAEGIVHDFKSTSTYTWTKGSRTEEHRLQGSLYRWLNPKIVTADFIRICYLFKDWSAHLAAANPNYPQAAMAFVDIPLMSIAETEAWVKTKLAQIAHHQKTPQDQLPLCSDEDLWIDPPAYKYYSDPTNMTRATKDFKNDKTAAYAHLREKGKGIVREIVGTPKRCGYCPAAPICSQRKSYE